MYRLAPSLAVAFATLLLASNALAADYPDFGDGGGGGMRPSFGNGNDWDTGNDPNSPIGIELGMRYWYSIGGQSFNIGPNDLTVNDQTHSGEAHVRIDDYSTGTYVKGVAGTSFAINGNGDNSGSSGAVTDGHVTYAGADLGFSLFGDSKKGVSGGPFLGYLYWNDSPNANSSTGNFTTAKSASDIGYDSVTGQTFIPGDSTPNNLDINALRLGFSGKANLGSAFDVSAEIAAVPYAKVDGILGATLGTTVCCSVLGNIEQMTSSPTSVDGWGYGAMAELLFGFHPTDNMTLRLGGRAWYLQGTVDGTFSEATIGDPSQSPNPGPYNVPPAFSNQNFIYRSSPFSLFRYGALAELTYKF